MISYKENKTHRNTLVLLKHGEIVATFGNLKKVLKHIEAEKNIPSYWTLARQDFPLKFGVFEIQKVKHF